MPLENVDVARRWLEGVAVSGMPPLELCDEAIEIVNVREMIFDARYAGHDGVGRWVSDLFDVIGQPGLVIDEVIDAGDEHVVTVQRAVGVSPSTGLDIDLRWAAVWTIRSGKVVHLEGFRDKALAFESLASG